MGRMLTLLYAVLSYAVFFVTFLYAVCFVGGFGPAPTALDGAATGPVGTAVLVDLALLGLFGLQHSIMARPGFKKRWTKIVPKSAERSTYVLLASLILLATFAWWRPIGGTVWDLRNGTARTVVWALFAAGWAIVFLGTWMIDHWSLFGLRQAWARFRGREFRHPEFQTRGFYRFVRHPLMLGFMIAFWATPTMTMGHLLFAGVATAYILVALQFEERDLMTYHPEAYREYMRTTPGLIPGLKRSGGGSGQPTGGIETELG